MEGIFQPGILMTNKLFVAISLVTLLGGGFLLLGQTGPALRILADGKVGIGTANPTETLEVNGTAKAKNFKSGQGVMRLCRESCGGLWPHQAGFVIGLMVHQGGGVWGYGKNCAGTTLQAIDSGVRAYLCSQ